MKHSCLMGFTIVILAMTSGCGSDTANTSASGTTSGAGGNGGGGTGGDATTTTSSAGGAGGQGGQGQGGQGQGGQGGAAVCPSLGDDCTNCLSMQCQDLYCNCFGNTDCVDLVVTCLPPCEQAADPDTCIQGCLTAHEGGISDALLVGGCAATTCNADCPAGNALSPCETCLFTNCPTEMNACLADPQCRAAIECAQQCPQGDFICANNCIGNDQKAQAAAMCGLSTCAAACQ